MAVNSLLLKRVDHRAWGVYGVLIGPDGPICVTLERPHIDGHGKMSHIKAGVYTTKLTHSPAFKTVTPELLNVPGRSHIRLHWGNAIDDSLGCILTGTAFDVVGGMNGKVGVTGSKMAFEEVMDLLRDVPSFTLHVSDF